MRSGDLRGLGRHVSRLIRRVVRRSVERYRIERRVRARRDARGGQSAPRVGYEACSLSPASPPAVRTTEPDSGGAPAGGRQAIDELDAVEPSVAIEGTEGVLPPPADTAQSWGGGAIAPGPPDTDRSGNRAAELPVRFTGQPVSAGPANFERAPGTPLPDAYQAWNDALTRYCLAQPATAKVYLAVTPHILAAAWAEASGDLVEPAYGSHMFAQAVAEAYESHVIKSPAGLLTLGHIQVNGLPACTAFLALSVLAAYEMHSDETAGPNAFYRRLAELMAVSLVGPHPRGFKPESFEKLWHLLKRWVDENTSATLAIPDDPGFRRFIALPLAHVPLRRIDTEKLPDFFVWAGYDPNSRVSTETLGRDFLSWPGLHTALTQAGVAALADQRRDAVIAQVALELESWDGRAEATPGRSIAPVYVHLDFVRRQPRLSYSARRPNNFPPTFDDGEHVLQGSDDGWYELIAVSEEAGCELKDGLAWTANAGGRTVELRRPGSAAIALAPATDLAGYLSRHGLPLGARCAVLCTDAICGTVERYLHQVSQSRCTPISHPGLPRGWRLFAEIAVTKVQDEVPRELEALEVSGHYEVMFSGGLRLGRGASWLAGAPPSVIVAGDTTHAAPLVDGEPVGVGSDGELDVSRQLDTPGEHVVEVGPVRRRIEVVAPEVRAGDLTALFETDQPAPLALPEGTWTLIGARTDEVTQAIAAGSEGAVAYPTFCPQWAVSGDSPRRSTVLCLVDRPETPKGGTSELTERQYQTLDEITRTNPEARVVGIVGEVAPGFHGWPPIIRYSSGNELALTSDGDLVEPQTILPLPPDAPQRAWVSAVCQAGSPPYRLGTVKSDAAEDEVRDTWSSYHDAAVALEHHWNRARQ